MKLPIALLGLLLATAASTPLTVHPSIRTDVSLANYLLNQQAQVLGADPAVSAQCFSLYLPLLNSVANQWSVDYANCVSSANSERDAIVEQMQEQVDDISTSASGVCQYIGACQNINDTLDFFNCFADLSKNVINTVYTISNNASDDAATLLQELELVDANMYKCTNTSERTYVEQTSNIYEALDDCLQNGLPPVVNPTPSTEAPADSTTAPDESTAAPPAESTAAPPAESTAAPPAESTAAPPAESTAAPPAETTAAPPAESTAAPPAESTAAPPAESTAAPPAESTAAPPAESTAADSTESSTAAIEVERLPEEDLDTNKWLRSILARLQGNMAQ